MCPEDSATAIFVRNVDVGQAIVDRSALGSRVGVHNARSPKHTVIRDPEVAIRRVTNIAVPEAKANCSGNHKGHADADNQLSPVD